MSQDRLVQSLRTTEFQLASFSSKSASICFENATERVILTTLLWIELALARLALLSTNIVDSFPLESLHLVS